MYRDGYNNSLDGLHKTFAVDKVTAHEKHDSSRGLELFTSTNVGFGLLFLPTLNCNRIAGRPRSTVETVSFGNEEIVL